MSNPHPPHLTGDARARVVALLFGEVTKIDHDTTLGPRGELPGLRQPRRL